MELAGHDPGNGEAVGEPVGVWTAMMMSVWRLAEVLYGPCYAPLGGMIDGNGLMNCADAPYPETADE